MIETTKTIEIEAGSELDRLLDEANGVALVLVKGNMRFRLVREEAIDPSTERDPWAAYDPAKARSGMEAAFGSWSDIDTEKLKADIYRWREEGTRPPDRP